MSAVIAALCIVVYVLAIASAAVQIVENMGERRDRAEIEFYDLADRATQSAVFLGFMSVPYQETIRDFIAGSETLLGVIISGSNGEYAFERYQGSGIAWSADAPRLKARGIQREPFYLPLRIEGQRNVNIQAIYSGIDSDFFLKVLRNTLLAILAALSIALIVLMVELTRKKKATTPAGTSPGMESSKKAAREVEIIRRPDFGETIKGAAEPALVDFEDFDEEAAIPVDGDEETGSAPTGLFTPRGNIGWEAYTGDRLASELHRCASFEQDLVFIAIDFGDGNLPNEKQYRQFAEEAVEFFSSRDLVFEKGENGLSVIVPSMNLEQGIAKSEEFRNRIALKLAEPSTGELCVGLSSRSGRLIDADRLMREAYRALEKASEDPSSPVVAFKSDPEKYREFITKADNQALD